MKRLIKNMACRLGFHKFYLSGMKHFEYDYVCINCGYSPTAPFNYIGSSIRSRYTQTEVQTSPVSSNKENSSVINTIGQETKIKSDFGDMAHIEAFIDRSSEITQVIFVIEKGYFNSEKLKFVVSKNSKILYDETIKVMDSPMVSFCVSQIENDLIYDLELFDNEKLIYIGARIL